MNNSMVDVIKLMLVIMLQSIMYSFSVAVETIKNSNVFNSHAKMVYSMLLNTRSAYSQIEPTLILNEIFHKQCMEFMYQLRQCKNFSCEDQSIKPASILACSKCINYNCNVKEYGNVSADILFCGNYDLDVEELKCKL